MDPKSMVEGAATAGAALGVNAATAPNKIKNGETSEEFKNNDLNKRFYKGYGFIDGTMPYVDPPSLKQRAATGVAGGLMKLLSGLVSDPKDSTDSANPLAILSQTLSSKVGLGGMADINTPLGQTGSTSGEGSGVFGPIIDSVARSLGLDPSLGMAVAKRESKFNRMAKGTSGELGAFQIKPDSAREALDNPDLADDDLFDPETNARAGLSYLKKRIDQFGGSKVKGIAAYNWGPGKVEKYAHLDDDTFLTKIPASVRDYVNEVLGGSSVGMG